MIINNNMSAMNAHRQLGANQGMAAKAQEKLSSGLRINVQAMTLQVLQSLKKCARKFVVWIKQAVTHKMVSL
ncbi:flagellin protein FlaA [Bacillus sp. JCM 19046]|nr:flagellin protein FlaA [Bacillus sp. JCM 19046]